MSQELSFDLIFESANEALFVVDARNACVVDANKRAGNYTGRSPAELRGVRFADLFDAPLPLRLEEHDTRHSEVLLTSSGPGPLPCEMTVRPAIRSDRPVHFVMLRDASRHKRAMKDLKLRNEAMASVTSGVTICDARHSELPLIYVNPGFERITGYSASESLGHNCRFLQGNDRDQEGLTVLRSALKDGKPCKVRLRNYRKDGSMFWNELHISPVHGEDGELTHYVGIQIDVTERVLDRRRLEASEELKTRFIRMVSHEFRTPMTGLRASAAFLKDYGPALTSEKRERHFLNIEKALNRMNRLLDDVLFSSRSDAGEIPFEPVTLDLKAFCEEVVEEVHAIHADDRVVFTAAFPNGTRFLADPALLNHILHNLLSNAIKYSNPEKPVWFRAGEADGRLLMVVEDEGIGIPLADQDRLFAPFQRAGNVGTVKGTGLGLYIVQRSAERHGGAVRFDSEPGRGSRFVVDLPAKAAEGGNP